MAKSELKNLDLQYTIAFVIKGKQSLMVERLKSPNQGLLNGQGGKLENETPDAGIAREISEEVPLDATRGLDIRQADEVKFAGIVTWQNLETETNILRGMYAYLVYISDTLIPWTELNTREGKLSFYDLSEICDPTNKLVVSNIPHFLPRMLASPEPMEYRCTYRGKELLEVISHPLSDEVIASRKRLHVKAV